MPDISLEEAERQANVLIDVGAQVFFKFTCRGCGSRQMFSVPNTLYPEGKCEECGFVTNLREHGVGYMLVI